MILNYEQFLKTIPTKKTFVLFGNKLTHSISSNIHNKIFDEYDIFADYFHVELKDNELSGAINHLKQHFCGANVTIPFKTNVMDFLDECDEVSTRLNSVNTILVKNGKTFGFNTDIIGIYESLKLDNVSLKNKKSALLGNGGTANVVADILAKNESDCTIFCRNLEKADELKNYVLKNYPNANIDTKLFEDFTDEYQLIFNTTPMGMNELEGKSPIYDFKSAEYVYDCIYNPQITKIIDLANDYNQKSRSGLFMLYTQALYAQNIFNDIDISRPNNIYNELSMELFKKRLKDKNIVLFGFMGCGKTTISNLLAQKTELSIIDTDEFIEKNEKMTINEIFSTKGEPYFRSLETNCANELSKLKNSIISVGGGFAINKENINILKENSVFVFLDTPFDEIIKRIELCNDRPLVKTENLKSLYETRYPIYSSIDAISVKRNLSPDEIVLEIIHKV